MATIDEMLNKKVAQRKPFKKVSYKPWESSFLSEAAISADDTKIEDELSREGRDQSIELLPEMKNIDTDKVDVFFMQEQAAVNVEKKSSDISVRASEVIEEISSHVNDSVAKSSVLKNNSNFENASKGDFVSITNNDVNTESAILLEHIDLPSETENIDARISINSSILPRKRIVFRLQSIIGISRLILFDLIRREEDRDDNFIYCSAVTTSELSLIYNTTYRVMATTINRLKARGYLFAIDGKRGKGGYSVYSVPLFVVKEIEKWKEQEVSH